jgi:hypothetical protein
MASFAASVSNNVYAVLTKVNADVHKIARELFTLTVDLTPSPSNPGPYATGHLADQWYPEVGDFSDELSPSTSSDGAGSKSRIAAVIGSTFFGKDGKLTFTNNVPYAYRAEAVGWPIEDGWSGRQGPYRMVARAIQAVAAKYQ